MNNDIDQNKTNRWQQTIFMDEKLATELIEEQMEFKVRSISVLGQGWDNIAYLVNKKYVFRFPRRQMGVDCMENEINVLPYINRRINASISCPKFIGVTTEKFPAHFAGYYLIEGEMLSKISPKSINSEDYYGLALDLGLFLRELHDIPVKKEHKLIIKSDQSWRLNIIERSNRVVNTINQYEKYFTKAGFIKNELLSFLEYFKSFNFDQKYKQTYCHGDLYAAHILINHPLLVSGIIDWGDIHIGNPGTDFSIGFMIFSDKALDRFFDVYGLGGEITYNVALFRAFWHPIILLPYCYETKNESLKKWTIRALKRVIKIINKKL